MMEDEKCLACNGLGWYLLKSKDGTTDEDCGECDGTGRVSR